MDPNANLAEQRRILALPSDETTREDLARLAELAGALDEWISGGGFLPDAWQR